LLTVSSTFRRSLVDRGSRSRRACDQQHVPRTQGRYSAAEGLPVGHGTRHLFGVEDGPAIPSLR
jgi:hypothetical protein